MNKISKTREKTQNSKHKTHGKKRISKHKTHGKKRISKHKTHGKKRISKHKKSNYLSKKSTKSYSSVMDTNIKKKTKGKTSITRLHTSIPSPSTLLSSRLSWKIEDLKARDKKYSTIGMFDSGIGGLTVYMELKKRFPKINIVYFADMARQPYGPRPQEQVGKFCDEILTFLKRQGAGIGIIACNTATAATFDNKVNEKNKFDDFPIFGTIPFAAKAALGHGKRVGVIATHGTCKSGAYVRALGPRATCIQMPCPEFISIVESGTMKKPYTKEVARKYMKPCKGNKIDSLIYGCTHYPILSSVIEDVMFNEFGETNVKMVNPAEPLVDKILELIEECEGKPTTRFCINKNPSEFAKRANRILKYDVTAQCELVDL